MQHFCSGTTAEGFQCRRTQLNQHGYCYHHAAHDPQAVDAQTPQLQPPQKSIPIPETMSRVRSDSLPNNSNNSGSSEEQQYQPKAAASAEPSVSVASNDNNSQELPRCIAIAKSTGLQCKKHVSIMGQLQCPRHGGKQLKIANTLQMCAAISRTTRSPCKNQVTTHGASFCTAHGGGGLKVSNNISPSPIPQLQRTPSTPGDLLPSSMEDNHGELNARSWGEIQAKCIQFLMETHPKSGCRCNSSTEPCKGIKIVMWAQSLVQLAQTPAQTTGTPSVFKANIADLLRFNPLSNDNGLFSDLYLAVAMFGAPIFFLPRFYSHLQNEVVVKVRAASAPMERQESQGNSNNSSISIEEEEDKRDHF
jgi:hypothetical protein